MLSISERQTVPKVSYVTGLDYFVTTCFGFCFSALLEFAIVNHFTIIRPKKLIDNVCQSRTAVQHAVRCSRMIGVGSTQVVVNTEDRYMRDY